MIIEWSTSEFRSDGSRRRPPPNSLHGWLAKMRGTLTGNEDLRSRGMREMKDAQRYKERRRQATEGKRVLGGLLYEEPAPQPSRRPTQQRLTRDRRSASQSSGSRKPSQHRGSTSTSSPRPRPAHRSSQASSRTLPAGDYTAASRSRPAPQRRGTTTR